MAELSSLGFISGDSHINEPRDLWKANLPASMRDQAMQGIVAGDDGNWSLILDSGGINKTSEQEELRVLSTSYEHRIEIMREEGILGECIFPTIGLYVWMLTDPDAGAASCRVYNEWIAEQLGHSPRFKCAGLVPTWRVEDAVAEVRRIKEMNLGCVMLPAVAAPDWNHRQWEPLWAAIEESELPCVMHQGTGHSMYFYRGPGAGVSNLVATQSMAPRAATLLATSGALAYHPGLHVVFVEFNAGWLGWTMQTADFYTDSFSKYGFTEDGKQWITPELPERPSFYMQRQLHCTFQDDPVGINNINLTGTSPLIWGSDYPHEEGTYPHSRSTVALLAKDLDDTSAEAIFRTNAAKLFNFSDEVLALPV